MSNVTNSPNPGQYRRPTIISGVVVLLFSLYLLVFLVPDVIRTASGPQTMNLIQASEIVTDESTYVAIENARWDCDSIVHILGRSSSTDTVTTRNTEIFFTDRASDGDVVVLAQMSGRMECAEFDGLTPTGYLTTLSPGKRQELNREDRLDPFDDADVILDLCGFCGQENSMIGAIVGAVVAIIGLAMIIVGYRMPKGDKVKHESDV